MKEKSVAQLMGDWTIDELLSGGMITIDELVTYEENEEKYYFPSENKKVEIDEDF